MITYTLWENDKEIRESSRTHENNKHDFGHDFNS